jgi:carbamate kinase
MARWMDEGHFPPGSMGPKIQSAIEFLRGGGREVVITSPGNLIEALAGRQGTRIRRD